ncbi:2-dehydro-3-deoxygalactonokinase [Larkinella punicea]|uniref:2-keto-3-deoxy-galactonokinase n=1 Tax=Larkinella punicea TaxID=2315727 RepID=A0A368JXL1_9BACT|nr:2-dehydro-3-deoxygalactonokinase [Larkinella punicea]RCR70951.1 2-keto-3-deoxy-galactonokinase [Larkinella punicea]
MSTYLLCCDWGTSFFRLRLINRSDYRLIEEVTSQQGIASIYTNWKAIGERAGIGKEQFFRDALLKQIDLLASNAGIKLDQVPVAVSGMASSSIGMDEIPYASLPFAMDGSQASFRHFDATETFPHELILISGVRSQEDVMRGEETQLIGLTALLDREGNRPNEAIFIFPGTHSKHMYVQGGQLLNFETYMTGEVFNLMASTSILKDSVDVSGFNDFSEGNLAAFKAGLSEAGSPLLNRLFTVRTNQLFGNLTKQQNAFYLSGLLIGAELKPLQEKENWQLVLCSGTNLFPFYKQAIEDLKLAGRTTTMAAERIDKAAIIGQVILFQNQNLNV